MEIKDRLKEALSIRGIKQADLADMTGIDKSLISSYLAGRYKPKQENLSLIAGKLNVDVYWLMGQDVPMEIVERVYDDTTSARLLAYVSKISEMRTSDKVLKVYGQLSQENRDRAMEYMEKLLKLQMMDAEVDDSISAIE